MKIYYVEASATVAFSRRVIMCARTIGKASTVIHENDDETRMRNYSIN